MGEPFHIQRLKYDMGFIDYQNEMHCLGPDEYKDEVPVLISTPFEFKFGRPQSVLVGQTAVSFLTLLNTSEEEDDVVEMWSIKVYDSKPDKDAFTLASQHPHISGLYLDECFYVPEIYLDPDEPYIVRLTCKPRCPGQHTALIQIIINGREFLRTAVVLAEDEVSLSLASTRPYSLAFDKIHAPISSDDLLAVPNIYNAPLSKIKLPHLKIPNRVNMLMQRKLDTEVLRQGLCLENYVHFFTTLLVMEELHIEREMRSYDMECVELRRFGKLFTLKVPGLAERRPSLVNGDIVFANLFSDRTDAESIHYQGYVCSVGSDEVLLSFSRKFHNRYRTGCAFAVHFSDNREKFGLLYQAVEMARELNPGILFPSSRSQRKMVKASFTPVTCNLNKEQMHAVGTILACKSSPPYVIFGPPGTGKTLTLVEAILQIYTSQNYSRILICAASNSATDRILELLVRNSGVPVQENDIFRLHAPPCHNTYEDVSSGKEYGFGCPNLSALKRYRVIISTYAGASCIIEKGLRRGHFSHVFLDDAGQASEPEAMVPISSLCNAKTVVVLSGDPMQLGPVVYSKDAGSFGLGKSYLGRLLEADLYYEGNEMNVMKLTRNYRSHPVILELPSKLFYNGALVACKKDDSQSSSIIESSYVPNKKFPVVFYGVQGCDERDRKSPSWFNRFEVSRVVEMIRELTQRNIRERDIGVITPYRLQAMKISKVLDKYKICNVKVGSVEDFVGQEREVIIVSYVRSTMKHAEYDERFGVGFSGDPKMFNAVMSRAKSLLILVGNPHIVHKDVHWRQLLWYCVDNNSYKGSPPVKKKSKWILPIGEHFDD